MGKSREVSEKRFPQAGVRRRRESQSGVEKKHHRCEFATEPFPGINKHVINHPKPFRRAGMHARSTGRRHGLAVPSVVWACFARTVLSLVGLREGLRGAGLLPRERVHYAGLAG
jgi:hypothetical protein